MRRIVTGLVLLLGIAGEAFKCMVEMKKKSPDKWSVIRKSVYAFRSWGD